MDRRTFLKRSGTLAVGVGLANHGVALAETRDLAAGRTILPLNRNWRYRAGTSADAHQRGIDDSDFVKVTVPHTNIPLPWHGFDDKKYEFVSVYRRKLQIPPSAAGKRVFVDFEGVMLASTVYLNGERLGEYRGGFTPFSFELTKHLDPGGDNLLSLDVDSTERKDIPPFGSEVDYLTFGGIYREVAMRIVPQVFIENIYAQPTNVLADPSLAVACYLDSSGCCHRPFITSRLRIEIVRRPSWTALIRDRMNRCRPLWRASFSNISVPLPAPSLMRTGSISRDTVPQLRSCADAQ